jgi:terminase small subunit-like protein
MPHRYRYRPAIAKRICDLISAGHGYRHIRAELKIGADAIAQWLKEQPEFRQAYDQAYVLWAEVKALEMMDIASDETIDHNTRRLQIDTLKFLLANRMSSRWGKRIRPGDQDADPFEQQRIETREELQAQVRKRLDEAFAEFEPPQREPPSIDAPVVVSPPVVERPSGPRD